MAPRPLVPAVVPAAVPAAVPVAVPAAVPVAVPAAVPVAVPAAVPVAVPAKPAVPVAVPAKPAAPVKPSVIDVPGYQKLVPQSPKDLVIAMRDAKLRLDSMNFDELLKKASNTTESRIANAIQTMQENLKILEQICK